MSIVYVYIESLAWHLMRWVWHTCVARHYYSSSSSSNPPPPRSNKKTLYSSTMSTTFFSICFAMFSLETPYLVHLRLFWQPWTCPFVFDAPAASTGVDRVCVCRPWLIMEQKMRRKRKKSLCDMCWRAMLPDDEDDSNEQHYIYICIRPGWKHHRWLTRWPHSQLEYIYIVRYGKLNRRPIVAGVLVTYIRKMESIYEWRNAYPSIPHPPPSLP